MFCEKCGTQLDDGATFCTKCGNKIGGENLEKSKVEKIKDVDVIYSVKPKFKFTYRILPSMLIAILFLALPTLILTFTLTNPIPLIIVLLAIITCYSIKYLINKKQYDSYLYEFYRTKVVFKDSFLNMSEKEVKYKNIREVSMHQGLIQRIFKLGSIILYTNAESGFSNGIVIVDVENPTEVYKNIKELINI